MARCAKCSRSHRVCTHKRLPTHLVIPDCQVKPGVPLDHLTWLGKYIAHKRPDVIVCIGDFADMPSLSSYDKGKKSFEGRRYKADVDAAKQGMANLVNGFGSIKDYSPKMILTLGNHEDRINRSVEEDAKLDGVIGIGDLEYDRFWNVIPFLKPVSIDGIEYAHYFTTGSMGRACSSARAMLNVRHGSCIQGHHQQTDVAFHPQTQHIAIMAGCFYQHDEAYLGAQGNVVRRQVWVLHEVNNGLFDPMPVSLDFLRRRYGR